MENIKVEEFTSDKETDMGKKWLGAVLALLLILSLGAALAGLVRFGDGGLAAFLAEHAALLRPAAMIPMAITLSLPIRPRMERKFGGKPGYETVKVLAAGLIWLISLAALLGDTYNPFIYFRF